MTRPALPIELWLAIFRWATISHTTPHLRTIAYQPFHADTSTGIDKEAILVKRALTLVCKQWQQIAMDFLLEDIIVHRDGGELRRVLEQNELGYGRVRRALLPYYSCISREDAACSGLALLASCTRMEALARPPPSLRDDLRFDFAAPLCPPLLSLKRLDWWHSDDAARSGGINLVTEVLVAAPHLEYLSLGGEMSMGPVTPAHITLSFLSTLRIRRCSVRLLLQVCRWRLPSLRHIIIDTYDIPIIESFWGTFGSQLDTVELGKNIMFCLVDIVQLLLQVCPNMRELSYHVQFASVPRIEEERSLLGIVRLHTADNNFFAGEANGFWEHIEDHLRALSSQLLPHLKRVVLYGDWSRTLADSRIQSALQDLRSMGREVTIVG